MTGIGSRESDLDQSDFMERVDKQRSRSINTHHDLHDPATEEKSPRLKIRNVSFVTNSGHTFHVRDKSIDSNASSNRSSDNLNVHGEH